MSIPLLRTSNSKFNTNHNARDDELSRYISDLNRRSEKWNFKMASAMNGAGGVLACHLPSRIIPWLSKFWDSYYIHVVVENRLRGWRNHWIMFSPLRYPLSGKNRLSSFWQRPSVHKWIINLEVLFLSKDASMPVERVEARTSQVWPYFGQNDLLWRGNAESDASKADWDFG